MDFHGACVRPAGGRAVERLWPRRSVSLTVHPGEQDERWTVERGLRLAAEAILEVCGHPEAAPTPPSAGDDRLAGAVVLHRLAAGLHGIGAWRNLLVHHPLQLDPARAHDRSHQPDDRTTFTHRPVPGRRRRRVRPWPTGYSVLTDWSAWRLRG